MEFTLKWVSVKEEQCGCSVNDLEPCRTEYGSGMTKHCKPAYRHSDGAFYLVKENK